MTRFRGICSDDLTSEIVLRAPKVVASMRDFLLAGNPKVSLPNYAKIEWLGIFRGDRAQALRFFNIGQGYFGVKRERFRVCAHQLEIRTLVTKYCNGNTSMKLLECSPCISIDQRQILR